MRGEKTASDLFVQAVSLKPRRFKSRLARTLAAGPNSRRDAEELESSRWAHNLTLLLAGTDTLSDRLLENKQSSGQFLGAGLRASTLRGKARNLRKFMAWLATPHQEVFPTSHLQYIQYLQVRQLEPSNRGALEDCRAAFQFLEEVAGLPPEQMQTSTRPTSKAADVRTPACGDRNFLGRLSKQKYLRIIGKWVLLQNWGNPRIRITVDDTGSTGVLSRSKTLGSDRTVGSRPVFVRAACLANFDRDHLLPVPTSSLPGCLQVELLYAAGFALLIRLLCALQFAESNRLVPQVAHFWTPHSSRSFMPSCAAALGFEKSKRDSLGGWSAQASDRYARIAKLRVESREHAEGRDQSDPLAQKQEDSLGRRRDVRTWPHRGTTTSVVESV